MPELVNQIARHAGGSSILEGEKAEPPSEAELLQEHIASSEPALLPHGIVYQAEWRNYADGMAVHAREQVQALAAAGLPVRLDSISAEGMFLTNDVADEVRSQVGWLQHVTFANTILAIRQCVMHDAEKLRSLISPPSARFSGFENERRVFENTVLYTSWERDSVAPELIELLQRCHQLWVPCQTNRQVFIEAGMPAWQVEVIPYPYVPGSGASSLAAPYHSTARMPDGKRFYHIGKWEPRKDQAMLLRAFLRGFTPRQRVSLALKTHGWGEWDGYPSLEDLLKELADDRIVRGNGWTSDKLAQRVQIIDAKVSSNQILDLHRKNNIYVSCSHGEAWDIPAFEARSAGNRLVHVGYGGTNQYAGPEDIQVEHKLGPVHPQYNWEMYARWAVYEEEALIEALRRAEPPARRVHPPEFNRNFSRYSVGRQMTLALESKLKPYLGGGSYG